MHNASSGGTNLKKPKIRYLPVKNWRWQWRLQAVGATRDNTIQFIVMGGCFYQQDGIFNLYVSIYNGIETCSITPETVASALRTRLSLKPRPPSTPKMGALLHLLLLLVAASAFHTTPSLPTTFQSRSQFNRSPLPNPSLSSFFSRYHPPPSQVRDQQGQGRRWSSQPRSLGLGPVSLAPLLLISEPPLTPTLLPLSPLLLPAAGP